MSKFCNIALIDINYQLTVSAGLLHYIGQVLTNNCLWGGGVLDREIEKVISFDYIVQHDAFFPPLGIIHMEDG